MHYSAKSALSCLLLAVLLSACARRPAVQVTTLAEGRTYLARPVPLHPVRCQQRVALPKP